MSETKYDQDDKAKNNVLTCVTNGHKYGYENKNGEIVIPIIYDYADSSFTEGLAVVALRKEDDSEGIAWEDVMSMAAEGLSTPEIVSRIPASFKYGFIDKTGKEVIPLMFDDADSFFEGLACVTIKGKSGFIDKTGKEIIPLTYDSANSFL